MNQFDLYFNPAHQKIKIEILMNVFDQVHKEMGLKAIMCTQLAKCALEFIPKLQLLNQMYDFVLHNSTLMETIHSAYVVPQLSTCTIYKRVPLLSADSWCSTVYKRCKLIVGAQHIFSHILSQEHRFY